MVRREQHARRTFPGHTRLQAVEPTTRVELQVVLRTPEGEPSLEETAKQVTRERKPWTQEEYLRRYAASPADVASVRAFAAAHGLDVVEEKPEWRTVTLAGPVGVLQRLFDTQLQEVHYETRSFRTHAGPARLPLELSEVVRGVFGLDTLPLVPSVLRGTRAPRPRAPEPSLAAAASASAGKLPWMSLPPPEFAKLYDFPAELKGKGACLGVLTVLGDYSPSDMERFFQELGMSPPDIHRLGEGYFGEGNDAWANFEVSMDVQVSASCAPEARIAVYFPGTRSNDDVTAWTYFKVYSMALLDRVNRPDVLTLSAGQPEDLLGSGTWTLGEAELINEVFMVAAILGVTLCLPSGDSGSIYPLAAGMFAAPSLVYFPGSSPWALCCGGTSLVLEDGAVADEVVWNRLARNMNLIYGGQGSLSNLGGSTGGVSSYFARPEWQQGLPDMPEATLYDFDEWVFSNPRVFQGRGCPDVAAHADFLTGYHIIVNGEPRYGGGTSAATPLTAALLTRVCGGLGRRLGFLNPLLYRLQLEEAAGICRTIVEGNNGGYSASPERGWNPCTGLGSLRGRALFEALKRVYMG